MCEVKSKEIDSIVENLRSTKVWHFLKNLRYDIYQYSWLHLIIIREWTHHYESLVENRPEFAAVL